jgi:hypothetical protein
MDPAIRVLGVVRSEGGENYAEIAITIEGCSDGPCEVIIGVDRAASAPAIRKAIAHRLTEQVADLRAAR